MMTVQSSTSSAHSVDALRTALAEGFAAGGVQLPVLPQIAARVMTLANDPDAELADLSDLIHQDQALAGNVLRIANSAAYCTGEAIVSLRQAVMRLGMSVLSEIAIAACLQGEALRTPGYEAYRRSLLVHAFISGGFAKELARQKRRNVEAMFLCGLMHTIGKPVVLRLVCDLQRNRAGRLGEAEVVRLAEEFQSQAAQAVTAAWKLPQQVQVVAVHHRDPESAPAFVEESRNVSLAGALATWSMTSDIEADAIRSLPAWEALNFYSDDVDAVLARKEALAQSAEAFMA
ncbi:MAG: HDOD domain-containing protein [Opitutaceae bacterium]